MQRDASRSAFVISVVSLVSGNGIGHRGRDGFLNSSGFTRHFVEPEDPMQPPRRRRIAAGPTGRFMVGCSSTKSEPSAESASSVQQMSRPPPTHADAATRRDRSAWHHAEGAPARNLTRPAWCGCGCRPCGLDFAYNGLGPLPLALMILSDRSLHPRPRLPEPLWS